MVEVRISVERPPSLSQAELWLWVQDRSVGSRPALTVRELDRGVGAAATISVHLTDDDARAELGELMMDLRLLGLRPRLLGGDDHRDDSHHRDRPEPSGHHYSAEAAAGDGTPA